MASTDDGLRRADGPAALGELLRTHAEVADAVLERFAAGQGPDGAPDAATLRNLRLGARAAVDRFLARPAGDGAPLDVALFEAHGRAQQAAGRTLTELRLKTLRELLGDALDDPDERFELALALRVTRD